MTNFSNLLKEIKYATPAQRKTEMWDIEGILKYRSNKKFKFDTRPLKNAKGVRVKGGFFKSKADKMVFDMKNQYIIIDTEEITHYIKQKEIKKVPLEELLSFLEWNIILPKTD